MNALIVSVFLTLVPLIELRGGLPVALIYAKDALVPSWIVFSLIVILNILLIFFVFFFLDKIHSVFRRNSYYEKIFLAYERRTQPKIKRFQKRHSKLGFLALALLVAVPLPLTGVYSGSFIAWVLELDRKKSVLALAVGTFVAGVLVYLGTQGIFALI